MPNARIIGTGFFVPETVVTNEDMTKFYDTSDEWIVQRSGIKQRHYAIHGEGPANLAAPAVEMALKDANVSKEEIELIVFATLSPECWFPGSACFLQQIMNFDTIPALDIRMQCSGFVYGLSIADQYIRTGTYKTVLVIGSEVQSTSLDFSNDGRTVGVLFGDGAGAAIVQATEAPFGILSTHLHTQGKYARELWVPEPSSTHAPKVKEGGKGLHPYMNGREVFRHAVTRMREAVEEALQKNNWQIEEVDLFIPHQANRRIAEAVGEQLNVPKEKVYINIDRYGNTTAASIPICLAEVSRNGILKPGDKLILTAFGSGFTWASAAIIW